MCLLQAKPEMKLDSTQLSAWQELEALKASLAPRSKLNFWHKSPPAKGIYLWGAVGRGKTMLMDRFFADLPQNLKKRRQHFHSFMQEVHHSRSNTKSNDIIAEIAAQIANSAKVLCLDEMQVVDIADAMILGRLFEALFAKGVTIVTTANQPPDGQYIDGLNRDLFLPYIAKLIAELNVIHLEDGRDYRLGRLRAGTTFITPLGQKSAAAFNVLWAELTDNEPGTPQDIPLLGRKLHIPRAAHSCARFSCSDLVEQALAAPDFLCIARNFKVVFIENIYIFQASQRNQAKRFILLIDTLYDAGTKLVATAEVSPEHLCTAGQHKVEFLRTSSRLQEMQSASWWDQPTN
jgi:cell division protein ZapE